MYLLRRLLIRCINSDISSYKEFTIYVSEYTDVNLLQEYVSKVKLIEGTYIFKGQYIAADVLKVNNGDILEIHKFRQKKDSLHEVRLQISKEIIEIRNIKVPIRITLQLLKFIIQSDVYIKIEHQRFQRNYREWSVNDSYILIPDDFENLTVVDILCIKNDYRPFTAEYEKYHSDEIGMEWGRGEVLFGSEAIT